MRRAFSPRRARGPPQRVRVLALAFAAADGPGRGDNPPGIGGILVIVGVILLAALVLGGLLALLVRRTRRSRGADVNPP